MIVGLGLHLESLQRRDPESLAQGPTFIGNNIVHPSAKIGSDCQIGPDVSIGLECVIGNGVRISNSVLLHRVKVRYFICAVLRGVQQRSTMLQLSLLAMTTAAQTQSQLLHSQHECREPDVGYSGINIVCQHVQLFWNMTCCMSCGIETATLCSSLSSR